MLSGVNKDVFSDIVAIEDGKYKAFLWNSESNQVDSKK